MTITLYPLACTTPRTRAELQDAEIHAADAGLGKQYSVAPQTACKWCNRTGTSGRPHRPHHRHCTMKPTQEAVASAVCESLWPPVDDLLVAVPKVPRPRLLWYMARYRLDRRPIVDKSEASEHKTFKGYASDLLHVTIKVLPRLSDESLRRHLFVGIDRVT